jgi:hypothetical protein
LELTQMKFLIKICHITLHAFRFHTKRGAAASGAAWETPGRRP